MNLKQSSTKLQGGQWVIVLPAKFQKRKNHGSSQWYVLYSTDIPLNGLHIWLMPSLPNPGILNCGISVTSQICRMPWVINSWLKYWEKKAITTKIVNQLQWQLGNHQLAAGLYLMASARGLHPKLFFILTGAPWAQSRWTHSLRPSITARWRAVLPWTSWRKIKAWDSPRANYSPKSSDFHLNF